MSDQIVLPGPAVVGHIDPVLLDQFPLKESRVLRDPEPEIAAEISKLLFGVLDEYRLPITSSRVGVQYSRFNLNPGQYGHIKSWHYDDFNVLTTSSSPNTEYLVGAVNREEFDQARKGLQFLGINYPPFFHHRRVIGIAEKVDIKIGTAAMLEVFPGLQVVTTEPGAVTLETIGRYTTHRSPMNSSNTEIYRTFVGAAFRRRFLRPMLRPFQATVDSIASRAAKSTTTHPVKVAA